MVTLDRDSLQDSRPALSRGTNAYMVVDRVALGR